MSAKRPLKNPLPKIAGYRIEGVLGRGATGIVYSAVQLAVDRPVAIKVLHPHLVGTKAAVRRLQREARTAARLAHPGIISAIDMGEQDGLWWYAMELVEGISLGERLEERGRMSEREALRFFLPLVEALQHAFEGGVVHRDVKPSNILVDAHGRARLVDLGLAFAEDDPMLTKPGGTLGTPHYMSPEQARDPSSADTRSDLWSLGASMYHAVCGRPPFEGDSVAEILSGVLYKRVPDPRLFEPQLSKGFCLVLRKCLTRDPEGRYASPAELLEDLERVLERRAPEVRVSALDPIDDGRPPWLRKALVGGGLAVLAAAALALWAPWSGGPEPQVSPTTVAVSWPALDYLREDYEAGRASQADAAERLTELAAPEGGEHLRTEFGNTLRVDLSQGVQGLRATLIKDLDLALRGKDLPAIETMFAGVDERIADETGYPSVTALPRGTARQQLERLLKQRRVRFSDKREQARREVENLLGTYVTGTLIPQIKRASAEHRWEDARALLDSRSRWLGQAGVELRLLPADEANLLGDAGSLLRSVRGTPFRDYEETVAALEAYLTEQEAILRLKIEEGGRVNVAAELEARFERTLDEQGIDPAQVPKDYDQQRPLRKLLKELAKDLRVEEARLIARDVGAGYRADLPSADALLGQRRYDQVMELWDSRLKDAWRADLHGQIRNRRQEAALLEGLMQRAAAGLRELHGGTLDVTLDGITHRARVVATRSPAELAREGFSLELPDLADAVPVSLRGGVLPSGVQLLPSITLLEVAGLAQPKTAEESFVRALFLFHEGRPAQAQQALPSGPFEHTVLLDPLVNRIETALAAPGGAAVERQEHAAQLLAGLRRDVASGRSTPEGMLLQGEQLLTRFDDLLSADERREIEDICVSCRRRLAPPTLEEAYTTAVIERGRNSRVSLVWSFEEESRGAWALGDWLHRWDQGLLRMTEERTSHEQFWSRELALRLPLGAPLATDEELDLSLNLRWADEHGSEFDNDVVLSMAGRHLLFVDGPPGGVRRWAITRGDPAQALESLREEADSRFSGFDGFPRDREFVLRVELAARSGRMTVSVDGVELRMPREPAKGQVGDQPELVLRSKYLLELFDARLAARLLK